MLIKHIRDIETNQSLKNAINYVYRPKQKSVYETKNLLSIDLDAMANSFSTVNAQRNLTKKYFHFVISFENDEPINELNYHKVISQFESKMGYKKKGLQKLSILHENTDKKHIHLIYNRVTIENEVLSDYRTKLKSTIIGRDITFNLFNKVRVDDFKRKKEKGIELNHLEVKNFNEKSKRKKSLYKKNPKHHLIGEFSSMSFLEEPRALFNALSSYYNVKGFKDNKGNLRLKEDNKWIDTKYLFYGLGKAPFNELMNLFYRSSKEDNKQLPLFKALDSKQSITNIIDEINLSYQVDFSIKKGKFSGGNYFQKKYKKLPFELTGKNISSYLKHKEIKPSLTYMRFHYSRKKMENTIDNQLNLSSNIKELERNLLKSGIELQIKKDNQGRFVSLSFLDIDNDLKMSGTDINYDFSAKRLLSKFVKDESQFLGIKNK